MTPRSRTSGLATKVLQPGTGERASRTVTDEVTVHYTGWTTDGKMFDSSVARGEPAGLPMDRVITGWTEGLQLMVVGEKRRLWIPEKLAYSGRGGTPQGCWSSTSSYWSLEPDGDSSQRARGCGGTAGRAPRSPDSGLAAKVLQPGTGDRHPKRRASVTVHYTGWTTDGKMFDSSVARGSRPASAEPGDPGLDRGLQLMVEGEKRRFWIPEKLAYGGRREPQGHARLRRRADQLQVAAGEPVPGQSSRQPPEAIADSKRVARG